MRRSSRGSFGTVQACTIFCRRKKLVGRAGGDGREGGDGGGENSPRSICSNFRRSTRNLSWCKSSGLPIPSIVAMSRNSSRLSKPDLPETLVVTVPSEVSDIVSAALLSFCITSSGRILSVFFYSHTRSSPLVDSSLQKQKTRSETEPFSWSLSGC